MPGGQPLLEIAGGAAVAVAGIVLASRGSTRLRRAGFFGGLYWASFRHFTGYRLRALRPLGTTFLGIVLAVAGLLSMYLGLTGFYAGRLFNLSG